MSESSLDKINVLIVDDDPVFRRILTHTFSKVPGATTVAAVGTLAEAQVILAKGHVRLVTLDVVMKAESGLSLLPWLTRHHPKTVVALLTAGQEKKASQAIDAVLLGAVALVIKPSGPEAPSKLFAELCRIVDSLKPIKLEAEGASTGATTQRKESREVIAVGASTGGPPVFQTFLKSLPEACKTPILLTQHISEHHVESLVSMLNGAGGRKVLLASQGLVLEPGGVYVAGRGQHLLLKRISGALRIEQSDGALENFCRPSVDPMFRSVADVCGRKAIGVVMTGMGIDGMTGCSALKAKGAPIIVQDKASSVVWGMPGAVANKGWATLVVPGDRIAAAVYDMVI